MLFGRGVEREDFPVSMVDATFKNLLEGAAVRFLVVLGFTVLVITYLYYRRDMGRDRQILVEPFVHHLGCLWRLFPSLSGVF